MSKPSFTYYGMRSENEALKHLQRGLPKTSGFGNDAFRPEDTLGSRIAARVVRISACTVVTWPHGWMTKPGRRPAWEDESRLKTQTIAFF
jgi:hypothetical protein